MDTKAIGPVPPKSGTHKAEFLLRLEAFSLYLHRAQARADQSPAATLAPRATESKFYNDERTIYTISFEGGADDTSPNVAQLLLQGSPLQVSLAHILYKHCPAVVRVRTEELRALPRALLLHCATITIARAM